jgi:hypothetical protein
MQQRGLTIPELILIAGTRVALGAGLGLLLGDNFGAIPERVLGGPCWESV